MNSAVEVIGLGKRYSEFTLAEVSFRVPVGYIMGFVGPNGAGKTTTIKAILGVIRPDAGSVRLFGETVGDDAHRLNQRLGVVMDNPYYLPEWKVSDVGQAAALFYRDWDDAAFTRELNRFGLSTTKRVDELSRGMKVKLQLAVAFSHQAELLVLDEPTSGLDPLARDELRDLLREFVVNENRSVLFSTHITEDLEKTADYLTVLLDGRVVFTGELDELSRRYVRVTGGVGDLDSAQRAQVIGYRSNGRTFDGLISTDRLSECPTSLLTEPATLDEIVVHLSMKGGTE